MNNKKKTQVKRKVLAVLLAAVMFGGSAAVALPAVGADVGITASAANDTNDDEVVGFIGSSEYYYNTKVYQKGDYQYIDDSNSITIYKYIGTDTVVSIPDKINGKPVVWILRGAFESQKNITKVIIPNSIIAKI